MSIDQYPTLKKHLGAFLPAHPLQEYLDHARPEHLAGMDEKLAAVEQIDNFAPLLRNLQHCADPAQFEHLLAEVKVGAILSKQGRTLQYEPPGLQKPPEYLVDGISYAEVKVIGQFQKRMLQETIRREFVKAAGKITPGHYITLNMWDEKNRCDSRVISIITKALKAHISKGKPAGNYLVLRIKNDAIVLHPEGNHEGWPGDASILGNVWYEPVEDGGETIASAMGGWNESDEIVNVSNQIAAARKKTIPKGAPYDLILVGSSIAIRDMDRRLRDLRSELRPFRNVYFTDVHMDNDYLWMAVIPGR